MTSAPTMPSPESLRLPAAYRQQVVLATRDDDVVTGSVSIDRATQRQAGGVAAPDPYWTAERIENSAIYQHHVYRWAAHLLRKTAARTVLDVGCGPGVKLDRLVRPHAAAAWGVDQPSAITIARELAPDTRFECVDLDDPAARPPGTFDVVICADVIEHLADPRPLLEYLRRACHADSQILLSTPDRDRLRGRGCLASPMVEHVREWSAREFGLFLSDESFDVLESRLLPADHAPRALGVLRELAYRCHLAPTSPWRCNTIRCRPRESPRISPPLSRLTRR